MCAGCPLHASLILNTGSKLGQKEVLFFRTMEKACPSSAVSIWWQARQNSAIYVPQLKSVYYS